MNEIWEVLGIEPTAEKRAIRSAYSERAKQCHPEENPQEFKRLHEAYQAALAYAAKNAGYVQEKRGFAQETGKGRAEKQQEISQQVSKERAEKQQEFSQRESKEHAEERQELSRQMGKEHAEEQQELSQQAGKERAEERQELSQQTTGENTAKTDRMESSEIPGAESSRNASSDAKAEPEPESEKPQTAQPSLLSLLEQAEEEKIQKSMCSGALKSFSDILDDPKKFRKAEAWKAFFMSEEFLEEQYSESFADGMFRILQEFHTPDNYNIAQMPSGFLTELAIAYALVLNPAQGDKKETTQSFYARETAAAIWKMQQTAFPPTRILLKPENQVRMRSFADYIRLKNFNSRGLLTRQNKDAWEEMLKGGQAHYLYELKGRGTHEIYPGSRSVCLLELYTFWLRMETVPKHILEFMYKEYDLRGKEHTSTGRLYEPLRKEIIRQYPDIEEALYGEEGRAKLVSAWYRELMQIISDSETLYEETGEIKERVRALFAREEWEKVRYLPELFEKMYLQLHDRSVMPASLAKRLFEFYSDDTGVALRAWDAEHGEIMVEGMIHSLYYGRAVLDMHGVVPERTPYFEAGKLKEVCKGSAEGSSHEEDVLCKQDFWHYFLMRGFGCRRVRNIGGRGCRRGYTEGTGYSLPAYMEYLYQPSVRWQKLFTGFGAEGAAPMPEFCAYFADENGNFVPGAQVTLPDQKSLRVEFHLHYVRYFLDGKEVFRPVYRFDECMELAKSIKKTEQFFFLLAITKIGEEDYGRAAKVLGEWLARLPLAPVSIPVVTRLLAEGVEEETAGVAKSSEPASMNVLPAESGRNWEDMLPEEGSEWDGESAEKNGKNTGEKICGIYYVEDEDLCFRAVVKQSRFFVSRLTALGWEHVYTARFPKGKEGFLTDEKRRAAQEFLQGLKRPVPVLLESVSLEGLENVEKAEKILDALKQNAKNRGEKQGLLPYAPGYPWEEKDTGRRKKVSKLQASENKSAEENGTLLQRFYRRYGGFLAESYCVLRFGADDNQDKKEHVFYASMKPFCFDLAQRGAGWPSSYQYSEKELSRKVKEKHWIIGHFGWGGTTGPGGDAVPKIIALGESGTFYYYDVVRLLRDENLAGLLAKAFDFSKIVEVKTYQGFLSISRFNGELEYCYGREAFLQSAYTIEKTTADLFTVFTKAEMMEEFADFMDGLTDAAGELSTLYFEFLRGEEGICSMRVYRGEPYEPKKRKTRFRRTRVLWEEFEEKLERESLLLCPAQERETLVWKIWKKEGDFAGILRDFTDALYWYMDCGRCGKKIAGCEEIAFGFAAAGGARPVINVVYRKEEIGDEE